ncbi:hypothetical protein LCGC14_1281280 [marine sediment metagenome]|uniref:Uncharacterized protein n=1 Tax=marine sediment metagenome TaxID=412755 RepID=A0A0F9LG74_9ZZZZ
MPDKKSVTEDIRHPMYEVGDKIFELKQVVDADDATKGDVELNELIEKLHSCEDDVYKHLDKHYLWD